MVIMILLCFSVDFGDKGFKMTGNKRSDFKLRKKEAKIESRAMKMITVVMMMVIGGLIMIIEVVVVVVVTLVMRLVIVDVMMMIIMIK